MNKKTMTKEMREMLKPKTNRVTMLLLAAVMFSVMFIVMRYISGSHKQPVHGSAPGIDPLLVAELKNAKQQASHWDSQVELLEGQMMEQIGTIGEYVEGGEDSLFFTTTGKN